VREVQAAFRFLSPQSAREHLEGLVEQGRLTEEPGKARGYLVRSILEARGPLSRRELAWELAIRQYGSDPAARQWLEELRTHAAR
jgi:predicted ArsR family transcriptional regulator